MTLHQRSLWMGLCLAIQLAGPGASLAQDDGYADEAEAYDDDVWERPPEDEPPPPAPKRAPKAEPPPGDGRRFDVGVQLMWGAPADKPKAFPDDAWNLGFGLRAAYTDDGKLLFPGVRAGLHFAHFLGSEDTNGQLVAAELAFDWWVGSKLVVRPSIDLGAGMITGVDRSAVNERTTRSGFYFGPGLVFMHPMDMLYVGGEIRATVVTNNLQSATTIAGNVGARF